MTEQKPKEIGFTKLLEMVNKHYDRLCKRRGVTNVVAINADQLTSLLGTVGLVIKMGMRVKKEPEQATAKEV